VEKIYSQAIAGYIIEICKEIVNSDFEPFRMNDGTWGVRWTEVGVPFCWPTQQTRPNEQYWMLNGLKIDLTDHHSTVKIFKEYFSKHAGTKIRSKLRSNATTSS